MLKRVKRLVNGILRMLVTRLAKLGVAEFSYRRINYSLWDIIPHLVARKTKPSTFTRLHITKRSLQISDSHHAQFLARRSLPTQACFLTCALYSTCLIFRTRKQDWWHKNKRGSCLIKATDREETRKRKAPKDSPMQLTK